MAETKTKIKDDEKEDKMDGLGTIRWTIKTHLLTSAFSSSEILQ
jgi:hypothetical protein